MTPHTPGCKNFEGALFFLPKPKPGNWLFSYISYNFSCCMYRVTTKICQALVVHMVGILHYLIQVFMDLGTSLKIFRNQKCPYSSQFWGKFHCEPNIFCFRDPITPPKLSNGRQVSPTEEPPGQKTPTPHPKFFTNRPYVLNLAQLTGFACKCAIFR